MTRNNCFLHGPLAGRVLLGPLAQENSHGEDEHHERHSRCRGHQQEAAIRRLIPGGILCGTDQSDRKRHMHHTESKISKTMSSLPPGEPSRCNHRFVCLRKTVPLIQTLIVLYIAQILKMFACCNFKNSQTVPFMCFNSQFLYNV